MNEKIKDLAVRTYCEVYKTNITGFSGSLEEFIDIFSQRLLERSACIADRAWNDAGTYPGNLIRRHFDIKS